MENLFVQFAFILVLCSIFGFLVLRASLPLIIAYLLSGVTLSLFHVFDTNQLLILHVFPDIGIALVLFLIGMELDLREIKALGKPIIISGVGQVIITTFLGFLIASTLGFKQLESIYIGLGLAFSSTVVVIKLLLEKREVSSLYGKLSVGISLVEDVIAIIVLMFISLNQSTSVFSLQNITPLILLVLKGIGLFVITYVLSKEFARYVFDNIAKSTELLFLTAIAWCFLFTVLAQLLGFSVEIGAFLAGLGLASSPYHFQIQGKIKPIRDFFLALFFVFLGLQVQFSDILHGLPSIIIFTLCALLLKPFVYLIFLGVFGFRKHTLFQTALNLSQVSEFSLIVFVVGLKSGLVSPFALSVMATVGVLSIALSSIVITHSRTFYAYIAPFVHFFVHKSKIHFLESGLERELDDHIVIFGAHHISEPLLTHLTDKDIPFVVMDVNPHLVRELKEKGINAIYGDMADPEVLDSLHLEKAHLIISTVSYAQDNEIVLDECKRRKIRAKIIVTADDEHHAKELKKLGADYVILPEQVTGNYLVNEIKGEWPKTDFPGLE